MPGTKKFICHLSVVSLQLATGQLATGSWQLVVQDAASFAPRSMKNDK